MYKINIPTELNQSDFIKIFGGVYEHSPWIAEQVYNVGLKESNNSAEGLHSAMKQIVEAADTDKNART